MMPDAHEPLRPVQDEPELQIVEVEPTNQPTRKQAEANAYEAYRRALRWWMNI